MESDIRDINDSLSAAMDGEASPDEVKKILNAMAKDPSVRQRWQEYEQLEFLGEKVDQPQPSYSVISWDAMVQHYESELELSDTTFETDAPQPPSSNKIEWKLPRSPLALAASFLLFGFLGTAIYINTPDYTPDDRFAGGTDNPSYMPVVNPQFANNPEVVSVSPRMAGDWYRAVSTAMDAHQRRNQEYQALHVTRILGNIRPMRDVQLYHRTSARE
ncbi:MAG: sigma-E factor negative regulatory protein [Gammaproteobacteria bacterium]|nr:sigma-E factor negative regulatory protein [Gammaproteobacteria bacterium]